MMREFGLIGFPLGHSFSKKYFTEKFERESISDCRYELFPILSIEQFPELIASHPHLHGLNVTIPYKKAVIPFLDDISQLPTELNACNCIDIRGGRLTGYNTDIVGFEKSFIAPLQSYHNKALVLGSGGAAAAVCYVLKKLEIPFSIVSRQKSGPLQLNYEEVSKEVIEACPVIINCTPVGTFPQINEFPEIPYDAITAKHYLFDLVYNPVKTKFLQMGERQGAIIQNGYDMLLYQAEEAWRIWNRS